MDQIATPRAVQYTRDSRAGLRDFHRKPKSKKHTANPAALHNLPNSRAGLPELDYNFTTEDYWRKIPAWKSVTRIEFADYRWQQRNCITSLEDVERAFCGQLDPGLVNDLKAGLMSTPMNIRITPYIFGLIDWSEPFDDPIRRQFLPFGSQFRQDHPYCMDDSLGEEADNAAPFLTHRYHDKVLFLPTSICPVYCLYCTRSRLVGGSTAIKEKQAYGAKKHAWDKTFDYIRQQPEIEDVVISGGDLFMVPSAYISYIGKTLLRIPHIRRIRFATKGIAVLPMRITRDDDWVRAIESVCDLGRQMMKEVCIHTHIASDYEMTEWTVTAMQRMTSSGVKVRSQAVLIRGVNDDFDCMYRTLKKLSFLNIQPYLVYVHDMVPGCEHLRTTLADAEQMSKELQGSTAGFNMPRFVCDAPGGGGKREISSYERYDRELGVSAWVAPRVKPGKAFYYYDPVELLPESGRALWEDRTERERRLVGFRDEIEAAFAAA